MDMSGEYVIPAPRKDVWEALNDPEILKQCIPGCESVDKTSDTEFEAKVTAKVGPVRAKFTGKVTLSDINPPNGYTISGEGSGGAAGFAKGGAKVSLSDAPEGTKLSYSVDATVGGKLAQIGSRLIDSTAKKMANEFFSTFADLVMSNSNSEVHAESEPPEDANAAIAAADISSRQHQPTQQTRQGLSPTIWVIGVIVAALALIFLF